MLSQEKEDKIYNALLVGMTLNDAYIYAGLTPEEISIVSEDTRQQSYYSMLSKQHEFTLLNSLHEIARKQERMGKEGAVTWMLEKMYPRYSSKPQSENPTVNIHFDNIDPTSMDTVTIKDGN